MDLVVSRQQCARGSDKERKKMTERRLKAYSFVISHIYTPPGTVQNSFVALPKFDLCVYVKSSRRQCHLPKRVDRLIHETVFGHCNRSFSRLRSACATCDQVRVKTRQVLLYLDRIWRLYDERMVSRPDCAGGRELGAADANDLGNSYQGLG